MKVPRFCRVCRLGLYPQTISHGFDPYSGELLAVTKMLKCPRAMMTLGFDRHDKWYYLKGLFGSRWVDGEDED